MYVFVVQLLVVEWCDAFDALLHGKLVLDKVKNGISQSPPDLPRSKPNKDLKISMRDAKFVWDLSATTEPNDGSAGAAFQLNIEELNIPTV